MKLLAARGFKGVTIAALSTSLGVTSGSFYHHFGGGWHVFVDDFLRRWEEEETARYIELARLEAEPEERLRLVIRLALGVPHEAESAIRAWSNTDEAVAAAQSRVDLARLAYMEELIGSLVSDTAQAKVLARYSLSAFVGAEKLHHLFSGDQLSATLGEVERSILWHSTSPTK